MQPLILQMEQLAVGEQIAVKCLIPLNSHFVFKAEVIEINSQKQAKKLKIIEAPVEKFTNDSFNLGKILDVSRLNRMSTVEISYLMRS